MACPAPPVYESGETVLAFLSHEEGELRTVGLSYGTLYPSGKELDDFREMIQHAIALRNRQVIPEASRLEWLVEAAARPGTRWHGLYELQPATDGVHAYYDRSNRPALGRKLEPRQFQLLADAFAAAPRVDRTSLMMLSVLGDYPDARVDRAAIAIVEALLERDTTAYWLPDLLAVLLPRLGDPDPVQRLAVLSEPRETASIETVRALWSQARFELSIPEVPPAAVEEKRRLPVGGETPD
ncbi:MAG: hypothetical protein HC897_00545 [Thermoanaerobaculia bacterium]|nr:hypothetical protein [Thermoanaerobaculia bacterium]